MCPYRHDDKCNRGCRGFQARASTTAWPHDATDRVHTLMSQRAALVRTLDGYRIVHESLRQLCSELADVIVAAMRDHHEDACKPGWWDGAVKLVGQAPLGPNVGGEAHAPRTTL